MNKEELEQQIKEYFKKQIDTAQGEELWKILDYSHDICEIVRKGQ